MKWVYGIALTLVIIATAITLSLPNINVNLQPFGYGKDQTMVWALEVSNPSSSTLSNIPVSIRLSSINIPGYENLFSSTIVIAEDVDCSTPIAYWVETKNSSFLLLWFKVSSLAPGATTDVYMCAVATYTSGTFSNPDLNGLFPYFTDFKTSTSLVTTYYGFIGSSASITYTFGTDGLTVVGTFGTNSEAEIEFLTTGFTGPAPYYFVIYQLSNPISTPGLVGYYMITFSGYYVEFMLNVQVLYQTTTNNMFYGAHYLLYYYPYIGWITLASTAAAYYNGSIISSDYKLFYYSNIASNSFIIGGFTSGYTLLGTTYVYGQVYFPTYSMGLIVGRVGTGGPANVTETFVLKYLYVLPYYGYFPEVYLKSVIFTVNVSG